MLNHRANQPNVRAHSLRASLQEIRRANHLVSQVVNRPGSHLLGHHEVLRNNLVFNHPEYQLGVRHHVRPSIPLCSHRLCQLCNQPDILRYTPLLNRLLYRPGNRQVSQPLILLVNL